MLTICDHHTKWHEKLGLQQSISAQEISIPFQDCSHDLDMVEDSGTNDKIAHL